MIKLDFVAENYLYIKNIKLFVLDDFEYLYFDAGIVTYLLNMFDNISLGWVPILFMYRIVILQFEKF